jgi:hypothetical protein
LVRSKRRGISASVTVFLALVIAIAGGLYIGTVLIGAGPVQSSTTGSGIDGVVTGYVTVGPSQPVCSTNQSCNENLTGYSLVFKELCTGSMSCQTRMAQISPNGHYSILLPAGVYEVTGLSPSCAWVGCSSAFPVTMTVEGGMQLVRDFNIDTGIR